SNCGRPRVLRLRVPSRLLGAGRVELARVAGRGALDLSGAASDRRSELAERQAVTVKCRLSATSRFFVSRPKSHIKRGSKSHRRSLGLAVKWYAYVIRERFGPRSSCRIDAAQVANSGGELTIFTAATVGRSNDT